MYCTSCHRRLWMSRESAGGGGGVPVCVTRPQWSTRLLPQVDSMSTTKEEISFRVLMSLRLAHTTLLRRRERQRQTSPLRFLLFSFFSFSSVAAQWNNTTAAIHRPGDRPRPSSILAKLEAITVRHGLRHSFFFFFFPVQCSDQWFFLVGLGFPSFLSFATWVSARQSIHCHPQSSSKSDASFSLLTFPTFYYYFFCNDDDDDWLSCRISLFLLHSLSNSAERKRKTLHIWRKEKRSVIIITLLASTAPLLSRGYAYSLILASCVVTRFGGSLIQFHRWSMCSSFIIQLLYWLWTMIDDHRNIVHLFVFCRHITDWFLYWTVPVLN